MTTKMTEGKNSAVTDTTDREIVVSRIFDAPRELVWEAMTDPNQVVKWWGPRGFTTTIEEMDVRPGGVWKHVMHGPDGADYPNKSIFQEVVKPERLVYSHGGGRKGSPGANFIATWTFEEEEDNKTRLTMRSVFSSKEARDAVVKAYAAIEGAKQTLERLSEQLAKEPVVVDRVFKAPAGLVWKAITELDQMRQWYFENLAAFKAEVGFETEVNVNHNGEDFLHRWKITEVVPGKKITYRWSYAKDPGESFVTFELFAEENKTTRLVLTHRGLETFDPAKNPKYARGKYARGWTQFIGVWLKEFVEDIAPFEDRTFVISRLFDAPLEAVWKAWTDSKEMVKWWGPRDFTTPVCEIDARPGGTYRIVMRSPDGVEYPLTGTFREIVPQEKLVMIMDCSGHPEAWHDMVNPDRDKTKKPFLEMLQTVTFERSNGQTKLTVRSRMESSATLKAMVKMGMNEGWSQSMERLSDVVGKVLRN